MCRQGQVAGAGFHTTEQPIAEHITGQDGRTLAQTWQAEGMAAYKGTTIHGFPNLFQIVGPNTGLGHSSMVFIIESQIAYVLDALRSGVTGYILKTKAAADLVQAIREVSRGAVYLSAGIPADVLRDFVSNREASADPLSGREREVLQLIAEGKTMKEIAALLGISLKTLYTRLKVYQAAGHVVRAGSSAPSRSRPESPAGGAKPSTRATVGKRSIPCTCSSRRATGIPGPWRTSGTWTVSS